MPLFDGVHPSPGGATECSVLIRAQADTSGAQLDGVVDCLQDGHGNRIHRLHAAITGSAVYEMMS